MRTLRGVFEHVCGASVDFFERRRKESVRVRISADDELVVRYAARDSEDYFRRVSDLLSGKILQGRGSRFQVGVLVLFLLNFLISTPLLFAYIYCILNAEFLSDMIVRLGMIAWVMFCIYFLIMFIPSVCVYVRRLHDCGHDGLILTLWFVPIINIILFFYFALRPGVNGPNQYGPKPKRRD